MIMSEILKNIETCRGEDVLAEVSALPQDPHFGSLVNEALDPLKQQALHQAGYDGYSEVIAQHKPYTFASAIVQMKSNLLLLRALWQFPFGSGTLRSLSDDAAPRSLSDMWQHYITRLSGNETYGIPSRLDQLTDLPSAPLLVSDRKISGADTIDGISVARLISDATAAAAVTTMTDDNSGWTINNTRLHSLLSIFTGLQSLTINGDGNLALSTIENHTTLETLNMPEVTAASVSSAGSDSATGVAAPIRNLTALETLYAPKLADASWGGNGNQYSAVIAGCQSLKKAWLGKVTNTNYPGWGDTKWVIQYCEALEELHVAGVVTTNCLVRSGQNANLILLEFTEEQTNSANLAWWSPTNALDASLDTLVTDEDCHNNLEQFLKNFRTYIALRLTDNGSGLTLTLSAAVYDAIKDESHLFVFPEGTMTIYAYLTNIKHWTVTK